MLITGGAGFIGSSLAVKLNRLDHEILVIDDLSTGNRSNLPSLNKLKLVKGDITDHAVLTEEFERFKPETVIHLAAIHFIPYCNNHPLRTLKVNIVGTKNLLECAREVRPKNLLFASTAAVYAQGDDVKHEGAFVNPIDIYGITKIVGEELSNLFYLETRIPTIAARIFNVYGPGDPNPHLITEIVRQIKSGRREVELGNLSPKRDFIHVNDITDVIIALIEKSKGGFNVFNIGSGKEHSVKEIVELCSKILGKQIGIKQIKERIRENERMHLLADIRRIKETTGWSPRIELKEGLENLLTNPPLL